MALPFLPENSVNKNIGQVTSEYCTDLSLGAVISMWRGKFIRIVHEDNTIAMIQALLPAGADISTRDQYCDFMLDQGANIFLKNKTLSMPLLIALDRNGEWLKTQIDLGHVSLDTPYDHPLPDHLLLGASITCPQLNYFTTSYPERTSPLIYTIPNYDFGLAKFLLLKGANPNFEDSNGLTPIMHAVRMSDVKLVKLLLNYYYDPKKDRIVATSNLRLQLSEEQSQQVLTSNFEVPKEKNPDDLLDEEVADDLKDNEKFSLSKHTEKKEDSVDFADESEEDEELILDEEKANGEVKEEAGSDHDMDLVEEVAQAGTSISEPIKDLEVPSLAVKLSLTKHVSQLNKERQYHSIPKTSGIDLSLVDNIGAGETALDLAQRFGAENIVPVLNKFLAEAPYNRELQPFVLQCFDKNNSNNDEEKKMNDEEFNKYKEAFKRILELQDDDYVPHCEWGQACTCDTCEEYCELVQAVLAVVPDWPGEVNYYSKKERELILLKQLAASLEVEIARIQRSIELLTSAKELSLLEQEEIKKYQENLAKMNYWKKLSTLLDKWLGLRFIPENSCTIIWRCNCDPCHRKSCLVKHLKEALPECNPEDAEVMSSCLRALKQRDSLAKKLAQFIVQLKAKIREEVTELLDMTRLS